MGDLLITPDEKINCQALSLTPTWEIKTYHKRPKKSQNQLWTEMLSGSHESNPWLPATEHHRRFRVRPFSGPYSYQGKSFEIECFLLFRADIPWGFDPQVRIPIRIEPAQVSDPNATQHFGREYKEPPVPKWSSEVNGKRPTIQLTPQRCPAGQEVSLSLSYEFSTQAIVDVSFICSRDGMVAVTPCDNLMRPPDKGA